MTTRRKPARKAQTIRKPPASYDASAIVLYQAADGSVRLDVRLEQETIWLSQKQMAELFATERSVITKHLHNIFASGELRRSSVCAFFAHTAADGKTYRTLFYNLDAVISVGYRVNSKRGTQFRIWATQVLREHILKGYTINERRLKELNQAVRLIAAVADRRDLSGDEAKALLRVVSDYSLALELLDDYDHGRVGRPAVTAGAVRPLTRDEALRIVENLRTYFGASDLFGREKDNGLESTLGAVMQTAGKKDVYPSLEEKTAHLLYFLVKNHAFVDGNKRIGAALFLWFLEKNGALYDAEGRRRLSDTALVALTLMIAESRPAENEIITNVTARLLRDARRNTKANPV